MAPTDQRPITLRIVIEQPVIGVLHSLQAKDESPLDPKSSQGGEPLQFDFQVRIAPGRNSSAIRYAAKVRCDDPSISVSANMPAMLPRPGRRRMKIDVHDIGHDLLDRAAESGGVIETIVIGTGKDGTPACATLRPTARRIVER